MKIQLCPMCKKSGLKLFAGGQTGQYQCPNCGYIGVLIIEKKMKK